MWNEDRFSRPSWSERMAERRICRYGYDPYEVEAEEIEEEDLEEMEAESNGGGGFDDWTVEQKRKIAPAILAGYAELEKKGFHFSDEAKAKWRAYL